MDFIISAILISVFGAILGSFVNVLIDRIPQGVSPLKGRSYCQRCKRQIKSYENIPIVSYFVLRGKCAGCGDIIPKRLIVVEVLSALGFVFIGYFLLQNELSVWNSILIFSSFLIFVWIFFTDLDYGIIPDYANISLLLLSLVNLVFFVPENLVNHFLSGLFSFAFFALLFFGTKGKGMGFGDVKLSFVLGLLLGFPSIVIGLYGAFLTGAAVSIILVLWKKKNFKKSTVPFGPFMVFSAFLALLYGEWIFQNIIMDFL